MPRRLSLLAPKRLLKPPKNSKQSCCAARTPSPRFFLCGFCSVWRGRHTKNKARTGVCAPHGVGRILGLPLVLVLGLSLLIVLGLRVARAGFHPAPIARDDLTGVLD